MNLTNNFTLEELIHSEIADRNHVQNDPDPDVVERLTDLCKYVLQPCRDRLDAVITVTSGFRSPVVNALAKGALDSQHIKGEAADMKCFSLGNKALYNALKEGGIYDQLIWEYGNDQEPDWVHVSFRKEGNRKQELRIY